MSYFKKIIELQVKMLHIFWRNVKKLPVLSQMSKYKIYATKIIQQVNYA